MAAARLRKTFRFRTDSGDDEDDDEVLDDEGSILYSGIDRPLLISFAQSKRSLLQSYAKTTTSVTKNSRCAELSNPPRKSWSSF